MAVLPRRLDRSIPQGRRPVVRVNSTAADEAAIDAAGMAGRGLQNVASGLNSQANAMQRAQDALDETDYLEAKGKFLQAKVEQDNAFDQDPDWGTYEKRYGENLGKARADFGATIKNGKLRRQFEIETQADLTQGAARIKSKAWDRETKDGVDNLNNAVTEGVSSALKARDEPTRTTILQGLNARIDAAAKAQYITGPGAKELKRKVAANYAQQSIGLLPPSQQLAMLVPGAAPNKITQQALPAPQDYATRVLDLESSGGKNTKNPKSTAFGKYQWIQKTADQYGITRDSSEKEQDAAFERFTNDNRIALRSALGREPTNAELYLAHQQGASGASALLSNPDQPAIYALTAIYGDVDTARDAILNNGGSENMTAGQFTSLWTNKFNGGKGEPIGQVISGEIPEGGWDFSQPTGTAADYLDPTTRAEMIASAAKAMKDEAKTAREAVQVSVAVQADDANQNAYLNGKTDPTFEAKIMAAYPDERGAKMLGEYRSNAQAGADNNLIKAQTLAQDTVMLAAAEQAAMQPGPGSAEAAKRYGQIASAIKQKHDQLAKDPAQYVIDNDPGAADAAEALTSVDPATPEGKIQARIAYETILQSQERLGVKDTRVLPDAQAQTVVDGIMSQKTAADQFNAFLTYADAGDAALSRKMIGELSGKDGIPPGADLVASVAIEGNDHRLAEKLWTEIAADTKGVELGTAGKKAVTENVLADGAIGAVIAAQAEQTGDALGLNEQLQPFMQAVEQVAKARVAFGMDPVKAAQSAVADLSGSMQTISDPSFAQIYFPKTADPTLVEDGLYALRDQAAALFPDDPYSQSLARDIRETGVWVNDGDGVSLVVPGTGRSLITKSFDDVLKAGRDQSADLMPLTGYEDAVDQIKRAPTP